MEVLLGALTVTRLERIAWVLAVVAGVALLLSMRAPRLGSRLGWLYPAVMTVEVPYSFRTVGPSRMG